MMKVKDIFHQYLPSMEEGVVGIEYEVGSSTTGLKNGVAHFIEHLIHREHSGKFYNQLTAKTSKDQTKFQTKVHQDELKQSGERLFHLPYISFNNAHIEEEREIIKNEEKEKHESRAYTIINEGNSSLFHDESYGSPVIGSQSNILSITKQDLMEGIDIYVHAPVNLYIIGPWSEQEIRNVIEAKGQFNTTESFNTSISQNELAEARTYTYLHNEKVYINSYRLPGTESFDEINFALLKKVWEKRISSIDEVHMHITLYHSDGAIILDNKRGFDLNEQAKEMLFKEVSYKEYRLAQALLQLEIDNLHENLESRLNPLYKTFIRNGFPSYKELNRNHNLLSNRFSFSITSHIAARDIGNEKDHKHVVPELVYNKEMNGRYLTVSSSPLTDRIHLMLRVNSLSLGRLLVKEDIKKIKRLTKVGFLTSVRYEGVHTLLTFTFYNNDGLRAFINNLDFVNEKFVWNTDNKEVFYSSFENRIKYKMFELFVGETEKVDSFIIEGISVVGNKVDVSSIEKFLFNQGSKPTPQLSDPFQKGSRLNSIENGAAVLYKLPNPVFESLKIQEAAFALNGPIPSLVERVREAGLAYSITQSICKGFEGSYIYWAIPCETDSQEQFYHIVRTWLRTLSEEYTAVESWFNNIWIPWNVSAHKSVFHLLRDVDRNQYFKSNQNAPSLQDYINTLIDQKSMNISINKEVALIE
ncbi:peptidase M16 family protein [Pontibacillus marinus]|uniref:Peptidase M16 N-terminal domain-containing protein n=1 Tax=Pontibacillus marinus BH030004 = DSM 16465 TaxID=1385511 RepID=A0A0A5G959_9BACI|nr:insulinase family protein [Pontibacillus marinus]KGX89691.1 hypothetical protein N783_04730 [Pontibacillus marinus BH030004 = DSM 16465]